MAAKKKTKTKTKKKNSEMFLALEGNVFFIEKVNGKEVSKEEISGVVVLNLLLQALVEGVTLMENQLPKK